MFKLPLFGVVCDVKGKDAFLVGYKTFVQTPLPPQAIVLDEI